MQRPRWRRIWSPRFTLQRRFNRSLIIVLALLLPSGIAALALNWDFVVTAAAFADARGNQTMLRNFLYRMPKGGDLHVHLSGGVYAERYIAWAAADGLCVRQTDYAIVAPPCDATKNTVPAAQALSNQAVYDRIVNALSMRDFLPTAAEPSGHDHFFAAFGKFSAVSGPHFTDMVVDQLAYYGAQSAQYVELMTSFSSWNERQAMDEAIKSASGYAAKLDALTKAGLGNFVAKKKDELAAAVAEIEKKRGCDVQKTRPGCAVSYRFIAQLSRNSPLDDVFVQTAIAAALARIDPQVVGFNYVQAEDAAVARAQYSEQMRIVDFLSHNPPGAQPVQVSLHAGELWLGLVPSDDLTFHIGEAVMIAGAQRIGHGVDLGFERNLDELLKTMRQRHIAVEINLTSNDQILGVHGAEHPFPAYRAAGVPVVLSTDDAAVERIDLTNEYVRAARDYGLSYSELKSIARASLIYSFLNDADRSKELARFDAMSAAFEHAVATYASALDGLILIVKIGVGWR